MLIRIYLTPEGKPFAVLNQSRIGKLEAIEKIHARLNKYGYSANFIVMELTE